MKNKLFRYFDDWKDYKNEAVLEEELDEQGVNFDEQYEGNEIELD